MTSLQTTLDIPTTPVQETDIPIVPGIQPVPIFTFNREINDWNTEGVYDVTQELDTFMRNTASEIMGLLESDINRNIELVIPVSGALILYDMLLNEISNGLAQNAIKAEALKRLHIRVAYTVGDKLGADGNRVAFLSEREEDYEPDAENDIVFVLDDMRDEGGTEQSILGLLKTELPKAKDDMFRFRYFSIKGNEHNGHINPDTGNTSSHVKYTDKWILNTAGLNSGKFGGKAIEKRLEAGDDLDDEQMDELIEIEILERLARYPMTITDEIIVNDSIEYKAWLIKNSIYGPNVDPTTLPIFGLIREVEKAKLKYLDNRPSQPPKDPQVFMKNIEDVVIQWTNENYPDLAQAMAA